MVYRAAITIAAWVVGALFLVSDGQVFTHGLVILAACVAGAAPWLPLLSSRQTSQRRAVAGMVVGLSAVVMVWMGLGLPKAYEAQRGRNERTAAAPGAEASERSGAGGEPGAAAGPTSAKDLVGSWQLVRGTAGRGEPAEADFRADGRLFYSVLADDRWQIIHLRYEVDGQELITDQPSRPRKERSRFAIERDG